MGSIFNPPVPGIGNALASIIGSYRRVTHVRCQLLYDRTWELITHLKADGLTLTKEQVVEDILAGRYRYYTFEDGTSAPLIVERRGLGSLYVRTKPDCSWPNNLLNLPRF